MNNSEKILKDWNENNYRWSMYFVLDRILLLIFFACKQFWTLYEDYGTALVKHLDGNPENKNALVRSCSTFSHNTDLPLKTLILENISVFGKNPHSSKLNFVYNSVIPLGYKPDSATPIISKKKQQIRNKVFKQLQIFLAESTDEGKIATHSTNTLLPSKSS